MHPSLGQTDEDGTKYSVFLFIQSVAEVSASVVADWILVSRDDSRTLLFTFTPASCTDYILYQIGGKPYS